MSIMRCQIEKNNALESEAAYNNLQNNLKLRFVLKCYNIYLFKIRIYFLGLLPNLTKTCVSNLLTLHHCIRLLILLKTMRNY